MFFSDNTPDFFALFPDPNTDQLIEEDESLEDTLHDHIGKRINWTRAELHRVSEDTTIPGVYLPAVECIRMRVDAHGIAWVCHPKHLDADVRTSIIPWKFFEGQRLFAPAPSDG